MKESKESKTVNDSHSRAVGLTKAWRALYISIATGTGLGTLAQQGEGIASDLGLVVASCAAGTTVLAGLYSHDGTPKGEPLPHDRGFAGIVSSGVLTIGATFFGLRFVQDMIQHPSEIDGSPLNIGASVALAGLAVIVHPGPVRKNTP